MLSSLSDSLLSQVYDLHGFLLFRSIQFNPTLAQKGKRRQSGNLITEGAPAFLCLSKSLNEGAKRAGLLSWQFLLPSLTPEQLNYALPATVPRRRQELRFQSVLWGFRQAASNWLVWELRW